MRITTLDTAFEDDRGTITDILEKPPIAVTIVQSNAGAIRGNHYHRRTTQWTYVQSGRLQVTTGPEEAEVVAGQTIHNPPGEPHAWRALEDTVCVVVTYGPRGGRNYESDTHRLAEALIS